YPTGFQIVGLQFATGGCWEVNAKAGTHELRFVTEVNPVNPPVTLGTCPTLADAVKASDAIVVGSIRSSYVDGRYVWHDVLVLETWKSYGFGDRFYLTQDLQSESMVEKGKQYVLFVQYTNRRLVCAQNSLRSEERRV